MASVPRLARVLFLGSLLLATSARAELADSVRERWTFLLQHLVHENSAAASALIDELKAFKTEHGIRDLFPEAEILHAMGVQAQGREQGPGARGYFELARDLAPDLPGPWIRLGVLELVESDSSSRLVDAARSFGEGFGAVLRNPESALRWTVEAIFFALALGVGVTLIFSAFLFVKYLRLVVFGLSARFGDRIPAVALVVPVLNVALAPFFLWGSLLLTAAIVLVAGWWVGDRAERRWSAILLVLLGLAPGFATVLRLTLVLPDLPAVRLYRCELGLCAPGVLDALDRSTEVSRPWLLKVRGDYLSRNYRGDAYIFESARDAYASAMKADTRDPALWVNFGNLLVAGRRYVPERVGDDTVGQAVLLYDRALQVLGNDARVLSNKAVALDALGDADGSQHLMEQALAVDPAVLAGRHVEPGAARSFNHNRDLFGFVSPPTRVFSEMLTTSAALAPRVKNRLFGELSEVAFLAGWGVLLVTGLGGALAGRRRRRSHYCPTCGQVVVPRAAAGASSGDVCSTCFYQTIKGTYMEPREAVLFEIRQRSRRRWLAVAAAVANLVIPGLGLLARGRVFAGLALAGLFQCELMLLFHRTRWLAEPVLWQARDVAALRMILFGAIIATYVLAQLLLIRRTKRRGAIAAPTSADPLAGALDLAAGGSRSRPAARPSPTSGADDEARALTLDDSVPHATAKHDDDVRFLEDS